MVSQYQLTFCSIIWNIMTGSWVLKNPSPSDSGSVSRCQSLTSESRALFIHFCMLVWRVFMYLEKAAKAIQIFIDSFRLLTSFTLGQYVGIKIKQSWNQLKGDSHTSVTTNLAHRGGCVGRGDWSRLENNGKFLLMSMSLRSVCDIMGVRGWRW